MGTIKKTTSEVATANSGKREAAAIELWGKTIPQLEAAFGYCDKKDSASLPETAWFRASKASYQQQIDKILDAVIELLEVSGAVECQNEIKTLDHAAKKSLRQIADYRERRVSAPPEAAIPVPNSIWKTRRESCDVSIAAEEQPW